MVNSSHAVFNVSSSGIPISALIYLIDTHHETDSVVRCVEIYPRIGIEVEQRDKSLGVFAV